MRDFIFGASTYPQADRSPECLTKSLPSNAIANALSDAEAVVPSEPMPPKKASLDESHSIAMTLWRHAPLLARIAVIHSAVVTVHSKEGAWTPHTQNQALQHCWQALWR